MNLSIRFVTEKDVPLILQFIKDLAEYENRSDEVVITEDILHDWIFTRKKLEAVLAEYDNVPVGFATFYDVFATFSGEACIFIEDVYVKPEMRGKGFGKEILKFLAELAEDKGCGTMEWHCLKWNKPSIDFYHSIGAVELEAWDTFRLAGDNLRRLAGK